MVPRTGAHSCVGCRGSGSLRIVGRGRLPLGTAPGGLGCCGKAQWVLIAGSLLLLPAQVCRRAAVAAFSAFPKLFFFFSPPGKQLLQLLLQHCLILHTGPTRTWVILV